MINDHMTCAQLLDVVISRTDGDFTLVMEPVANRSIAACDAVYAAFDQIFAQYRHNARQWTHPARAFRADRGIAPAHRLGPGEIADDRRDSLSEQILHCPARLFDHGKIGIAPFDLAHFQLITRHAVLAAETLDCLIGRAFGRPLGFFANRLGLGR